MANYLTVALVLLAALSAQAETGKHTVRQPLRQLTANGTLAAPSVSFSKPDAKLDGSVNLLLLTLSALWQPVAVLHLQPRLGPGLLAILQVVTPCRAVFAPQFSRGP